MYEDRIEIINPGALCGVNKLEKLGTDASMESRNPTIVRILEENSSVIENRHSGIPTMKRETKKYGLPEPEFYEERDYFKVVFRKNIKDNKKNNLRSGQVSDTQGDTQFKLSADIIEKVLKYCEQAKTAKEIREYLGISSKRYVAYEIIKPLVRNGKLDFTNKNNVNARNQKYITKNKN